MHKKEKIEHFQQNSSRNLYILLLSILSVAALVVAFFLFKAERPAANAATSGGFAKFLKKLK